LLDTDGLALEGWGDLSPDGQRFLFAKDEGASGPASHTQINIVINWSEELKRRAQAARK
jgi:hypothetical protein